MGSRQLSPLIRLPVSHSLRSVCHPPYRILLLLSFVVTSSLLSRPFSHCLAFSAPWEHFESLPERGAAISRSSEMREKRRATHLLIASFSGRTIFEVRRSCPCYLFILFSRSSVTPLFIHNLTPTDRTPWTQELRPLDSA